jgi:hypothetical protein
VAAALAVAIALGLWLFGVWFGGQARRKHCSRALPAIFAVLVNMTDNQFRTLVWYLRAIVLLLAVIAVITFAHGGLPE